MEEKLKKAKKILKQENQEQLLTNFNTLSESNKKVLLDQILQIDFQQVKELYNKIGKDLKNEKEKIEPIPFIEKSKIEGTQYFEKGANTIKEGKLAVVTMAGGQGTRLRT